MLLLGACGLVASSEQQPSSAADLTCTHTRTCIRREKLLIAGLMLPINLEARIYDASLNLGM